ncbi:hypothetical protein KKC94_03260, partial [Patescibacteria group bacterium]|nr:hypothetical protein [Patescibacteria group bacterium]
MKQRVEMEVMLPVVQTIMVVVGGGGFVFIDYATSDIATGDFATYTDTSGGTAVATAIAGGDGSSLLKNSTNDTYYFIEGIARVPIDSSVCTANTCSFANLVAESGGEGRFLGDTSTGDYITVAVSGDVTVNSGGSITADESGCPASQSANSSTNICADGGSSEGGNDNESGGGGAFAGTGGNGSHGGVGGSTTYGDSTAPVFFGSGGGDNAGSSGGAGGGVLLLNITGTLTNSGTISANGEDGKKYGINACGGGGSGGSLYVSAATLAGASTNVFAKGGNGCDSAYDGGGGGGGRICIVYTTDSSTWLSSLSAATNAAGGTGPGAATDGTAGSLDKTTCTSFNQPPTATGTTATALNDGTGRIRITVEVEDVDFDDTVRLQVTYNDGGGDADPTLSTSNADTYADVGDPAVDNSASYQVGTAAGYILTSSGSNTVSFIWNSATDEGALDGTVTISVTPYDGISNGTASTSASFSVDNVDPTLSLSYSATSENSSETVSGTTEANALVYKDSVYVTTANGAGAFSFIMGLQGGVNAASVYTVDGGGNMSVSQSVVITTPGSSGGSAASGDSGESGEESMAGEEEVSEEVIEEEVVEELTEEEAAEEVVTEEEESTEEET